MSFVRLSIVTTTYTTTPTLQYTPVHSGTAVPQDWTMETELRWTVWAGAALHL